MPRDASVVNQQIERRAVAELRADHTRIVGHAIVFDVRSRDLGGFVEVIKPSAVDRALAGDVVCLYNHDAGAVLGRTPKTLTLERDTRGLRFSLDPANTSAGRDALELVRRGDVTGASFGFKTLRDSWAKDGATTIRTLLDVEIFEISLTALPVYQQTDVSVAQRAFGQWTSHRGHSTVQPRSIAALRQQLRMSR
jgi:HK97 family phage prohead protease